MYNISSPNNVFYIYLFIQFVRFACFLISFILTKIDRYLLPNQVCRRFWIIYWFLSKLNVNRFLLVTVKHRMNNERKSLTPLFVSFLVFCFLFCLTWLWLRMLTLMPCPWAHMTALTNRPASNTIWKDKYSFATGDSGCRFPLVR